MILGKCPKCEKILSDKDVKDVWYKGKTRAHIAYICRKCEFIIGFALRP